MYAWALKIPQTNAATENSSPDFSTIQNPPGNAATEAFRFFHYGAKPTTYSAKVQSASGAEVLEFEVLSKDIKAEPNSEVSTEIRYTPSGLKEKRAVLVLSAADAGE